MSVNYKKLLLWYTDVVGEAEGVDFLGCSGEPENNPELTPEENAALTEIRDLGRAKTGAWKDEK